MPEQKARLQYGIWKSPISPKRIAGSLDFEGIAWDEGGDLVWLEGRGARSVLVVEGSDGGAARDMNSDLSVHASVGYGGGDFCVGHGQVFFIEEESGCVYKQPVQAGTAATLTPAFGRAASPSISPDGRWLLYVHSYQGEDCLAIVDIHGKYWPQKLVSGDDFYMHPVWQPQIEPGQARIAWIAWNHPNMPWDGTELRTGVLRESTGGQPVLEQIETIAGGPDISIFQPEFSPDGHHLAYVSDETGWWQLYLHDLASGASRQLTETPADHGLPAWIQGMRTYAFSPDSRWIFFLRNQDGRITLWRSDLSARAEEKLEIGEEYTYLDQISVCPGKDNPLELALIASGDRMPPRLLSYQVEARSLRVRRRSTTEDLPADYYSASIPLTWMAQDGNSVHGLFYRPNHPLYDGVGKPPLIVMVHGGPTSQRFARFDPEVQFYTSRGYAVLNINYRGSSGYGRAYRNALRGNWGIYDVEDSISGAAYLAQQGEIDPGKTVIMGGSAGGYTVLQALVNFPGFFKAGVCLYGISNQLTLVADTHKFEAHYSDSLLGPFPEAAEVYRQRSPLFFAAQIQDPLAIFQGEIDRVVPRQQSDEIVEILRRRGVPHIYHVYPGEGHGFRKPESIEHFYQATEAFLRQYVVFA